MNRRYSVTACFDGNKRVVSGSEDGSIYVWDINSSKSVVQKLQGHNGGGRIDAKYVYRHVFVWIVCARVSFGYVPVQQHTELTVS